MRVTRPSEFASNVERALAYHAKIEEGGWRFNLVPLVWLALLALVCLLLPTAIAWLKYREVPGYHTWTAKTDAVLMGIAVPLLLLFDVALPFRIAALFLVVCAVDELGITFQLPTCHHDVPSLFHAARLRREAAAAASPGEWG